MLPYLDKGQKIPMYGVMMFTGIAFCFIIALFLDKQKRVKKEDKIYGGTLAAVMGIFGAKVLFIITSLPLLLDSSNNIKFVDIVKSGFVFYGGLIGGFVAITVYCLVCKIKLLSFYDLAALVLPVGQAFGRVGCFLGGCCYGRETDSFLGVVYHKSLDSSTPIGVKILPTQLFETTYCLLIFAVLFILHRKNLKSGTIAIAYLFMYSICRFINEFFRADDVRGFLFGLSTSQIISILLFIGASFLLWLVYFKKDKRTNTKPQS